MQLFSGWLDLGISDLVSEGPLLALTFRHVLITSLDSTRNLAGSKVGQRLLDRFPACSVLGTGVVAPRGLLSDVDFALSVFYGFDEIWLLEQEPAAVLPEGVTIIPPPTFDADRPSPELSGWMKMSGCVLGLADGAGTNFVTLDRAVQDVVLAVGERGRKRDSD